jgi:hypothetical protein
VLYVLAKLGYREWADSRTRESLVDPRRTSGRTVTVVVRWVPFIGTALLIGAVTVIWPVRILREFGVDQAGPIGAVARALSVGTLGVSTAVIVAVALWPLRSAWLWAVAGVLALWLPDWGTSFGTVWPARVLVVALVALAAVLGAAVGVLMVLGRALVHPPDPPAEADVTWALRRRDGHDPAGTPSGSRTALFGAMMIAGIPGLESLAEAARPPFLKNVMVVRHHADGAGAGVIEFQAWGLDDESPPPGEPARDGTGFFPIEFCRVDASTMQVTVAPAPAEAITATAE